MLSLGTTLTKRYLHCSYDRNINSNMKNIKDRGTNYEWMIYFNFLKHFSFADLITFFNLTEIYCWLKLVNILAI